MTNAIRAAEARVGAVSEIEHGAWLALMSDHAGLIVAYMRRVTPDANEQRELIQAAHAIAWFSRREAAVMPSTPAWLVDCCRRARAEWAQGRRGTLSLDDCAEPAVIAPRSVSAAVAECDRDDLVWDAVVALPPRQRAVVVYRVLFSMSVKETAEALGCREGTVKAHLHAALERLRSDRLSNGLGSCD